MEPMPCSFLATKAVDPDEAAVCGAYDEAREITMLDGRPLVLERSALGRTQTFTNVAREIPDSDPGQQWASARGGSSPHSVTRTQTVTKAGGEQPDSDPHGSFGPAWAASGHVGQTSAYDETADLTLDAGTGGPLCRMAGTISPTADAHPA